VIAKTEPLHPIIAAQLKYSMSIRLSRSTLDLILNETEHLWGAMKHGRPDQVGIDIVFGLLLFVVVRLRPAKRQEILDRLVSDVFHDEANFDNASILLEYLEWAWPRDNRGEPGAPPTPHACYKAIVRGIDTPLGANRDHRVWVDLDMPRTEATEYLAMRILYFEWVPCS